MSLDDWSGMERFLSDDSGAWISFTCQETPGCIEAHQEAVERNNELRMLYMDVYSAENFDLVNPDVKYDYTGRLE